MLIFMDCWSAKKTKYLVDSGTSFLRVVSIYGKREHQIHVKGKLRKLNNVYDQR